MNWAAIAFDWNQVRAFLATAEEGSLSAAARVLGQTQPTLGRQVTALEETLGITLFERIGNRLELTAAGRELLTHVRQMAEAATQISLTASGQSQTIEGEVRITCSDVFSAHILPGFLRELSTVAPGITVDVVAANDIQDLQRREADIAIRHVRPDQPDLIARLVQEATAHFCAASSYLARRGHPRVLSDLNSHDFVTFGQTDRMIDFLNPMGLDLTERNFRVGSQSGVVAWELARAGLGVTIMSDTVIRRAPEMQVILPDQPPVTFPVWLTTHRELHTSARIRLVFDQLAGFLSKNRL